MKQNCSPPLLLLSILGLIVIRFLSSAVAAVATAVDSSGTSTSSVGSESCPSSTIVTGTITNRAVVDDPWSVGEGVGSEVGDGEDFWEACECDEAFDGSLPRPIPSRSSWTLLRGAYYGVVGPHQSTIDYRHISIDGSGFLVPIRVEHVPKRGRAVIAEEDIPEGTKIWDTTYTGRFPSPLHFRRFLVSIPKPLACDVMIWSYVEDYAWDRKNMSDVKATISLDMDDGSLLNSIDYSRGETKNVNYKPWTASQMIHKGEELLVDYREFEHGLNSWDAAGFGYGEDDVEDYQIEEPSSTTLPLDGQGSVAR